MSRQKDAYYFPHDYDSANDPKMQTLLAEYGAVGYGVFWRLVEMLHEHKDHHLPFEKYIYISVAKPLLLEAQKVEEIIYYSIDPCRLFEADGEIFWSERVRQNIEKRKELSEQRSKAGKASAEQRKRDKELAEIIVKEVKESITTQHPLTTVDSR